MFLMPFYVSHIFRIPNTKTWSIIVSFVDEAAMSSRRWPRYAYTIYKLASYNVHWLWRHWRWKFFKTKTFWLPPCQSSKRKFKVELKVKFYLDQYEPTFRRPGFLKGITFSTIAMHNFIVDKSFVRYQFVGDEFVRCEFVVNGFVGDELT